MGLSGVPVPVDEVVLVVSDCFGTWVCAAEVVEFAVCEVRMASALPGRSQYHHDRHVVGW